MTAKRRPATGKDVQRVLAQLGFELTGQKGSHAQYKKPGSGKVTLACKGEIKPGTFRSILSQMEISEDEFFRLLGE
ncbi:MAG: hypothetical protein CVV27_12405 [Candidatus Melainabacteria bacterium HGW-Melainabacteria-1]|nr:MAG: hypothetical protein CVV27_12405 [Candidatus Melainabacteria bacterium HGW-Melainabacteria-1]